MRLNFFGRQHAKQSAALLLTAGLTILVWANGDADHDYRHHVMEALEYHMKSISLIVRGEVDHEDHLGMHVDALTDLASIAHELFPEGSQSAEALPEIWENPEEFDEAMTRFQSVALELRQAAATNDISAIGGTMRRLGRTCKGCHDKFRE